VVELTIFFGKSGKNDRRSVGRIDKMDFLGGKSEKMEKKRSVEGLWVELTKWIFFGKSEKVEKNNL
jgi:hypothetical protein